MEEPLEQVQEPLTVEVEQLGVEEMFVEDTEVMGEPVEALADDEVVFLEVVAAPERRRRRRARREIDDEEYEVECVCWIVVIFMVLSIF